MGGSHVCFGSPAYRNAVNECAGPEGAAGCCARSLKLFAAVMDGPVERTWLDSSHCDGVASQNEDDHVSLRASTKGGTKQSAPKRPLLKYPGRSTDVYST
ncbi:unnamed protein product [Gongylonema pulchrum]|uniref:Uncharacterized protein n=1 Tax=Gongylonema pulchrum TaxID=637853 RepID=A0A183EN70_9BILA|nr:unnamed protein product [Gongylonema pulchrum]